MLPDGSRLHVVIPPITRGHMAVNIRKFVIGLRTLDQLVAAGSLSHQVHRFLDASVAAGLNILVSGGTQAGKTTFLVYPSSFAGTNKATAMSFQIPPDRFDAEAAALREKGITFSTFEADGLEWDDGVDTMGDSFKSAWFEDPDGNILNIESGM